MAKHSRLKRGKSAQKKHRLTLGEAISRIRHNKIYALYSIPPVLKRYKKPFHKQIERQILETTPNAKIEYLPRLWLIKGKVKDPWQDIKVSNITVGESLMITSALALQSVMLKG